MFRNSFLWSSCTSDMSVKLQPVCLLPLYVVPYLLSYQENLLAW